MSEIIETYQQEQEQLGKTELPQMAFATVVSVNEDGLELIFDGEEEASTKRFPCNIGVSFEADQRVLLLKVNGSYIALCPVGLHGKTDGLLKIGGKIYYDAGDNGASYEFYDAQKQKIANVSISGLADAVYYKVEGTYTRPRWYVYNSNLFCSPKPWGGNGAIIGATRNNGIQNTEIVLSAYTSAMDGSVWEWVKNQREQQAEGFGDWFLPALNHESYDLFSTGLVSPIMTIWTSDEASATTAYGRSMSTYTAFEKTRNTNAYAVRAI